MPDQINVIIVDDEQDGREVLRHMLLPCAAMVSIVGEAANADDAIKLIEELKPDLVFLDIQMSGKSGFAVLEQHKNIPFEVIFVTSYAHYALTAIKFNALDYLLKPLDNEELKQATEKAIFKIRSRKNSEAQLISLLESLDRKQNLKKIAVHVKDIVHLIDQIHITHIEAQGSYCKIYLQNGEEYLMATLLKEFELYFGVDSSFIRISKSVLVNTDFITAYSKGEPCMITLQKETTFEVSRRKKQEILDQLKARINPISR